MDEGRILLAEDDELLRETLARMLRSKGYGVTPVADGMAALEELKRSRYDLILTDVMMPRMTGEELLDSLDGLPGDKPLVIMITAHENVESAIKGIKAGVCAYIRKPFNMAEIEAAVRSALERRRLDMDLKRYYLELDRKVEERTRELQLLNSFSALVNRSFDLDVILDDAVKCIVEFMGGDVAGIYMVEGDPPMLHLKAHTGISEEFRAAVAVMDLGELYKGVPMKDSPVIIDDPALVQEPLRENILREGLTTGLSVPVRSGDRLQGLIRVASRTNRDFREANLQILTSFGNQIGVAIDRISMYRKQKSMAEDLRQKVNQLMILNEMGHLIKVSNRTAEAAMMVVSAIVQGIGFDRVCIWLLDEDGKTLSLAACHGLDKVMLGRKLPVSDSSLSALPLDDGDAFFVSGSVCDPSSDLAPSRDRGVVLAPLVTRNPGNKEVRCWEHFSCSEESCPAFKNIALTCWIIKDSCHRCSKPGSTLLDKLVVCRDCDVYMANRRGRHIGILCADNRTSGRLISDGDMNALNVFASSAAAILENIMLMERLVKNEHFIDSIIFNMSSGLLVADREGRVIMINYAGAEILRCEREDVIGQDFALAFPDARDFLSVGDPATLSREVTIKTNDGPVPVGYSNSYLIEHDGAVSDGVIVVFRDLSEIKKLHEQLREKDRFAAIGKVAAGVAHEIRNPLFGITSVAQILAREVKEATPQKALIDAMLSETSRLNTLVEDMLLYGRTKKVVPQPVDLNTLIENVLDFHMAGIREKDLKVDKDFASGLPPVPLDQHQMRQVFLNLLMNSLDASRRGGEITLKTRGSKNSVAVKISDNGVGIPEDDLPKVFDLFYTTKEKGTGLGLAICRKIVEDHGGQISIHSLPGKGTTVELVLPSRQAA